MRNDDESEDELVIEEPDTSQDSENMKKENRSPELSTTASDIQGEFKIKSIINSQKSLLFTVFRGWTIGYIYY